MSQFADISPLSFGRLHKGQGVVIDDVRCRAHRHGWGEEERTEAHQLVFVRAGVFMRRVAGREYVADANQVIFFNANEPYQVAHPTDDGDACTVLEFEPALLHEAMAAFQPRGDDHPDRPFERSHCVSQQMPFLVLQRLRQRLLAGAREVLATQELALDLLASVLREVYRDRDTRRQRRRSATATAHRAWSEAARQLLAERFGESLDLTAIARQVHCSPFHLARIFHRETGLTLHEYRHRLRLRFALERIAAGESQLARLAGDLGFSSHSHLTDAFRAAFGVSPSACRALATTRRLREMSKNLEVVGARVA
jgi:AraC family transcriptional regulator